MIATSPLIATNLSIASYRVSRVWYVARRSLGRWPAALPGSISIFTFMEDSVYGGLGPEYPPTKPSVVHSPHVVGPPYFHTRYQ